MTRREVVSVVTLWVVLASCGIVGSDYEPTDETFRKRLGTFISDKASNIDPIYGNIDVDSLFGKYTVNAATATDVLSGDRRPRYASRLDIGTAAGSRVRVPQTYERSRLRDRSRRCHGRIGYQIHTGHTHYPYGDPHLKLWHVNQDPKSCQCFWNAYGHSSPPPPPGSVPYTGVVGGGGFL